MKRRAFLRLIGGGAAALATAPLLPLVAAPKRKPSLSMRYVQSFDIQTAAIPQRLDVLYGSASLRPNLVCLVLA